MEGKCTGRKAIKDISGGRVGLSKFIKQFTSKGYRKLKYHKIQRFLYFWILSRERVL